MVFIVAFGSIAARGATAADTFVDVAWRSWSVPDYPLAETQFRAAVAADASCKRAYVGLALL